MKKKLFLLMIFLFLIVSIGYSQSRSWIRNYIQNISFSGMAFGDTYDTGSSTITITDIFTEIGASAHKSINVNLAYTPSATGAAAPIGIASKVTLNGGMTYNSASGNYQGLAFGVQGQIHFPTGATYVGSNNTDPGMLFAALRGILSDTGTSTYTYGTMTAGYFESQVSQDVTTGSFRHFLIWARNQGSGTATPITAAIYIDEGNAWSNTILTGIDINNTVKGMDVMATTTGIDFSSSMTQEIIGQNDETISNASDGKWDFGIAKLATTGSGRGTDQYEFVFDVTNRSGGIFPNGGPYKTYIYNTEIDRESDEDATGDSRDVMFKGVYRNYGQNANGLHVQGIGTSVRNESGGTLGSLKGGEFGVNNKSGATVNTQLYGLTATVENYGTPGSDIIAGRFDIRNEGTNATNEWGIHVTNTNNSQADAADAAIYVDDSGANIGWGYGLDMSGATIQTAEIRGSQGETWENVTTDGVWTTDGSITSSAGMNLGTSQSLVGTTAMTIGDNTQTVAINSSDWNITAAGHMTGIGKVVTDSTMSIGGWGYSGEHFTIPETSSNTNAGLGIYSVVDYDATAGKVFAGSYSRMLAMTADQTSDVSMYGTEAQFRLRDVDIATGVKAGIWAYAEQSGTSALTGGAMFAGLSATVESASTFTTGATEHIVGGVFDSSINSGASGTIDASTNFSAIYIKSNGLDWYDGINITGVDNDLKLHNGALINNNHADSLTITEAKVIIEGDLTVTGNQTLHGEANAHASNGTLIIDQASQSYGIEGELSAGLNNGFSFASGSNGVIADIASIAANDSIAISDATHGLVTGDYIAVQSANHSGLVVVTRIDADSFHVDINFVGDEVGTWQKGDQLIASAGTAGRFTIDVAITSAAGAASKEYHYHAVQNVTSLDQTSFHITTRGTQHQSSSRTGYVTVTAGDRFWLIVMNETDTQNLEYEDAGLILHKL